MGCRSLVPRWPFLWAGPGCTVTQSRQEQDRALTILQEFDEGTIYRGVGGVQDSRREGRGNDDWNLGRRDPRSGNRRQSPATLQGGPPCPLCWPIPSGGKGAPPASPLNPTSAAAERLRGTEGQTNGSQHRGGPEECFLQTSLPCDPEAGDQGATPGETPGQVCCGHPLGEQHFLQVTHCCRRCCGNTQLKDSQKPQQMASVGQ